MPETATSPARKYAHICPPHRTTDKEYADWVLQVLSTLPHRDFLYLRADIDAHDAWVSEAQVWRDELHAQALAAAPCAIWHRITESQARAELAAHDHPASPCEHTDSAATGVETWKWLQGDRVAHVVRHDDLWLLLNEPRHH